MSTSAALDPAAPTLASLDLGRAFLSGVPFRFGLAVIPTLDFLGRPRGRFAGVCASGSFNGTVVVVVLVTRLTDGESAFSSSLPGSACTVTLMRHGLALPTLGVLIIMDFAGDDKSSPDKSSVLFCLLGELVLNGSRGAVVRLALAVFSFVEMANGSGLES